MADSTGAIVTPSVGDKPTSGHGARLSAQLRSWLAALIERDGSDLHLKVGRPPTIRLSGDLVGLDYPALQAEDLSALAEQIMPPRYLKEFQQTREADFAMAVSGIGRFRVNAYQQRGTVSFALRGIPYQTRTAAELHLPAVVEELALRPRGLVLVTGITGSGKSTALAAMIHHVNQHRAANIITVEDPVEFLHRDIRSHLSQREVGIDTLSFSAALRRVLRQDPDVILIGEIRDLDTLDTALKAADTGHLVFSTLHTTDASTTIARILSFYPPHQQAEVRFNLANALAGIISLRLVPRQDGKGRVPACEVLVNTAAVRDKIRDPAASLDIVELIKDGTVQYGMQTFDQSLLSWYTRGIISYDQAVFYATNPSEFALHVQGVGSASDTSWDAFRAPAQS